MDATRIKSYLNTVPGWEKVAVGNVELVGEGWESKIYGFTASLSDVTEHLVLRMYTGIDGSHKALVESSGMPRLRGAGYPVPQVLLYELEGRALGLPFIVMERVFGDQLWEAMRRQPEHRTGFENAFVDLLVELHRLDWRPFLADGEPSPRDAGDLIRRDIALWRSLLAATPAAGFDDALGWFDNHIADVTPVPPSVVHNDFHPANILVTPEASVFVIDWTWLGVADPRSDLAWTLMLMESEAGPEPSLRVKDRYAAELPISDLDYFMAGAYVKRLYSLVASLTHGPESLGMRPEASNEMRQHLEQSGDIYAEFMRITGQRLASFEALSTS